MPDNPLESFRRTRDFLVAIDSDGCAFDTMEVKHKECFIPNTIKHFDLQAVSKFAREAAEFVNLYSKWRGINRFPALVMTLDLLRQRPQVLDREVPVPALEGVKSWIARETKLGMPVLKAEVEKTGDPDLARAYAWSQAVNDAVDDMVRGVPPFPFVRETLERLQGVADIIVCSATPGKALAKEWQEHAIARFTAAICGQEVGSKKEILAQALQRGYLPENVLMVGDAPGDLAAAKGNCTLFVPINPGAEDESWERVYSTVVDRFLSGKYAGDYERALIEEFEAFLPERAAWQAL